MTPHYAPTSISRRLIARMQQTHELRRISVFSGPPGIGKTTAIDTWKASRPNEVAVVKIGRQGAREALVLRHVIEAVQALVGEPGAIYLAGLWHLREKLFRTLCKLAELDSEEARKRDAAIDIPARLTLVFDEAQNLSRQAIDALRYWNDPDRCYGPFPLGIVFVGNNEFSLADTGGSGSVISAAVADRSLHIQSLEYEDLTDEDIAMVIRLHADANASAVEEILRCFRGQRAIRSLRRILDLLAQLRLTSRGPLDADMLRAVLHEA